MKKVIKTVVLVMMVSILFGTSASAGISTSKNTVSVSKGKTLQNKNNGKNRQAAGGVVHVNGASRLNTSVKSVNDKATRSAANSGSNRETSEVEGKVIEQMPNAKFRVELQDGRTIVAHLSGKLRVNFIRVHVGDRVLVELAKGDPDRGRIIWRTKC